MKKNKAMRAASVFLVLTLVSTCGFSGVLAKYVSTDNGSDTTRVAKYGVVASVTGDLFGTHYGSGTTNPSSYTNNTEASVSAVAATDKVLAPGTKNDVGMTFSVKGTPEVSTSVEAKHAISEGAEKANIQADVVLKSGNYGVLVPYNGVLTNDNKASYWYYDSTNLKYKKATSESNLSVFGTTPAAFELKDAVDVSADYYPIQWYYSVDDATITADTTKNGSSALDDVRSAIETAFNSGENNKNPNIKLDKSVKLTWSWAISNEGLSEVSANQDTILGNLMAQAATSGNNTGAASTGEAYAETSDFKVVKLTGAFASATEAQAINYTKVASGDTSVICAYTGSDVPSCSGHAVTNANVAILTASFDASLTVKQVD